MLVCDLATDKGFSCGTVQNCIHLGVGFSDKIEKAIEVAQYSAQVAYLENLKREYKGLNQVRKELSELVKESNFLMGWDTFNFNLYSIASQPFPLWNINREHIYKFVSKKLQLFSIFDLPGFIYLGKILGLKMLLNTRKNSEKSAQRLGRKEVPLWGGRSLIAKSSKGDLEMLGGTLHRFIVDLHTPSQIINQLMNI